MKREFTAWAVRGRYREPPHRGRRWSKWFLLGRYWGMGWPSPEHEGCPVLLFRTRAEARAYAKKHSKPNRAYLPLRVAAVLVKVTLEVES